MDSVDLDLLTYCTERSNWEGIKDLVTKSMCVKESWALMGAYHDYYSEFPDTDKIDKKDFKTWFRIKAHPEYKRETHELYNTIIENVFENAVPESSGFLSSVRQLKNQAYLDKAYKDFQCRSISLDELQTRIASLGGDSSSDSESSDEVISVLDLASHARHGGLYWRLEDLNRSVGPVSQGDFIVVGKRPEVGGTSFLCSELTFMLEQLPKTGKVVLFNNEEEDWKVKGRIISTALGVDYRSIIANPSKYEEEWKDWLDGREFKLIQDTNMTVAGIRAKLQKEKPDVIGINVLLKVGGTGKTEDHDKFQELGEKFRQFASSYAPVLSIVQADPSAEGEKFISQDRIYKSKTALQGEADVLVMIGTDEDVVDHRRYIHVAKNKIPPSACTDTRNKHIKSEVRFDIDTGRFESVNFKKHSRGKDHVYNRV